MKSKGAEVFFAAPAVANTVNFDHVRTKLATHICKEACIIFRKSKKKRIIRNFVSTFFIYALLLLLSYLILQITVVDIKRIFTKRFIRHAATAPTHTPAHILTVWSQWLQQAWGQH